MLSKKKIYIYSTIIIIFLIILFGMNFGFFRQKKIEQPLRKSLIEKKIKTDFETGFLKEEKYLNLKSFGGLPVKVGNQGRENPFEPYTR